MADPVGFTSAFGKLEQAIRELVGVGDVKERLKVATKALVLIFPDDFPAGHLRDEYADIRQAAPSAPLPPISSPSALLLFTILLEQQRHQTFRGTYRRTYTRSPFSRLCLRHSSSRFSTVFSPPRDHGYM